MFNNHNDIINLQVAPPPEQVIFVALRSMANTKIISLGITLNPWINFFGIGFYSFQDMT